MKFTASEKKFSPLTLIYLVSDSNVLLLKRVKDKEMVAGEWCGLGGKVEYGEKIDDSARREFLEETGLIATDLTLRGTFTWIGETQWAGTLFIYLATRYEGILKDSSDEGELCWVPVDTIETLEGFAPHQKLFLPKILQDEKFFYCGIAEYDGSTLTDYQDSTAYFEERKLRKNAI